MSDQPNTEPTNTDPAPAADPKPPVPPATPEAQPPAEATPTDKPAPTEPMIPKSRFDEINKRLKELEKKESEAVRAREESDRKAAEEQGKWKELYETERTKTEAEAKARLEAESKVKQAELATLRLQVGTELGLPPLLSARLAGETDEEIRADATKMLEVIPKGGRPVIPTNTDGPNGSNPKTPTPIKSDAEIQEQAARLGVQFEQLKKHYETQQRS